MKNGKRLEILLEIGALEDGHCANCELVTHQHMDAYNKNKYCHSICNIGLKMQELGKGLKLKEPEPSREPRKKKTKYDIIIELHQKGYHNDRIAEDTGFDKRTISASISRYRKKCGLPSIKSVRKNEIKELILQGKSAGEIIKIAGSSYAYINKLTKEIQSDGKSNFN